MVEHKHWHHLWWAILQHFGRECKKTWGAEVIAVIVGGVAGAATSYLRSRGHASFLDAVVDGLVTALIFFGIYVLVHLIRSPWLERKGEGVPPSVVDGIVGAILFCFVMAGGLFICHLVKEDWRSNIDLHLQADSSQLQAFEECKVNLAALSKTEPPEPTNSLRKRTIRLVHELNDFWGGMPQPTQQPVQTPTTDEERQRNAAWDKYWRDAKSAYLNADYRHRLLGIVREYKDKGIETGYMEQAFAQPDRLVGAAPFGGWQLDNCVQYMNDLCQIRELAFHVDARDTRIDDDFRQH